MKALGIIEILIFVAILAIVITLVEVNFASFSKEVNVDQTANSIISVMRSAQNNTVGSNNQTTYGVYFESNKYVLFKGSAYNPSDLTNITYAIPSSLELSTIAVSGGSSVIFTHIDGSTTNTGTLILRIKSDTATTRTIIIEQSGNITIDKGITLSNTRVNDSRHLHFNLGWSIQNASSLTLTFTIPSQVQTIPMAGYFNALKTEFDWSGSVSVGGENQTLRIHTHSLDSSSTVLSIHRDRRVNTKALMVAIDGRNIVSYATQGDATVQTFGGTMTAQ